MTLLLQFGILFAALIAPGLLTVYLAREVAPSDEREPPAEATLLSAITIAIALVSVEFVALSSLSLWNDAHRLWAGLSLPELVSSDPWAALQARPGLVAFTASIEYLAHLGVLAALGWWNPIRGLLRQRLSRHGLREASPYVEAVLQAMEQDSPTVVYASARLRDGRTYAGTLQTISFRPLVDGSRELFLQSVEQIAGDERKAVGLDGMSNGLLLNTRDVVALELAYAPAQPNAD